MAQSAVDAQGLSASASCVLAAACIVVFLGVLWFACGTKSYALPEEQRADRKIRTRRQFWYIFLGTDDRVSTSQVPFALWTVAFAYVLLVSAFNDGGHPVGRVDPRYVLLFGFSAVAAVSARAITAELVSGGAVSKNPPEFKRKTPVTAVKDIVANDRGDIDLGDTQYFIVTLVALAAFFIAFFRDPTRLPTLPYALVGLASASAAVYVAKKTVAPTPAKATAPLKVTAVSPQKGPLTTRVKIFGSGLSNGTSGSADPPDVTFGGLAADVQGNWTDTLVLVTLPQNLSPGTADVQVNTSDGRTATLPNAFELTP